MWKDVAWKCLAWVVQALTLEAMACVMRPSSLSFDNRQHISVIAYDTHYRRQL